MIQELRNFSGEALDFAFSPGADGRNDLVVIGHGVTANKDRPFLVALSEGLGAAGIASLRFSFSGNGSSGGRFEQSTISKEVADLGAVLDTLEDTAPARRLAYVGHSMGGAVGALRAAQDSRIRLLVSLAGMVHTQDFAQRKFGELTPGEGFMWDKPECPLSQDYMDDMKAIDNVLPQAAKVTSPWLLVHGTEDTVVPMRDSVDARNAAGGRPELVELAGADHVFSGPATAEMVSAVVPWLDRSFGDLA